MQLNQFGSTNSTRISQILHTLENVYGVRINVDLGSPTAESMLEECQLAWTQVKDAIISESSFNSYQQNPQYTKAMLILEAVRLMLTEIGPKRRRNKMAESIKTNTEEAMTPKKIPQSALDKIVALGHEMIDYSTNARPQDDAETKELNDFSRVGDKLANMGTAFGPSSLTPEEKNIARTAQTKLKAMKNPSTTPVQTPIAPVAEKLTIMTSKNSGQSNPGMDNVHEDGKDQDGDGDTDFADVMIARMVAGGMPKHLAVKKVKDKKYNNESMISESDTLTGPLSAGTKPSTVGQAHHYEYQASMSRSELYRNAKYAMSMLKQVDPQGEIQPWIAGALTKSANLLDKVYHYLDYYQKFEPDQLPENMDSDVELGETSGGVTRQNLMLIMEYSTKLFNMIKPGDKLEGWVAMKLTTASECVSSCKHYMDYVQFEQHALDDHFSEARKAKRKDVNEGMIISENEDLAKAQTILSAKEIAGKIQGMAEEVAKLSVEDLMPLVDVMREQFGAEVASGFNETVKASLEKLLDLTTQTKEVIDNSVNILQSGGIPTETSDIENTEPAPSSKDSAIAGDEEIGGSSSDDIAADLAGEETGSNEPLGRAKKDELAETIAVGKKVNITNPKATPRHQVVSIDGDKVTVKKPDGSTATLPKARILRANPGLSEGTVNTKPDFLDVDKDGNKKESFKKAVADKKKTDESVDESTVEEKAPPGKEAEKFIKDQKEVFKKRYGKDWERVLYATAWKQFGESDGTFEAGSKRLAEAKSQLAKLELAMTKHRNEFKNLLAEGIVSDPLNLGYGLKGDEIVQKIERANRKISEAKSVMRTAMQEGVIGMLKQIDTLNKAGKMADAKTATPYGIIYETARGRKSKKMFEDTGARDYWVQLRGDSIKNVRMIEPETFDKAISAIKKG